MTLSTLENQIKTEYGVIRAFVAIHPWAHTALMLACGFAVGFFWSHL